ncbi:delta-1-pyrroline-5-carboxylate dehydrogenase, mitochondrial [Nematostella vectensis]|uniref:delta-1-pyrroline-5-carboxylate dehydrogenase, mitochondrial n=1 Tax=Nematostella vectensis TaxID=45351 RepID=UPI0020775434|nr:delta-1-pyrroline-5-carboxylate dehydrogenase, mitochondrial [Nematostella vectensis]
MLALRTQGFRHITRAIGTRSLSLPPNEPLTDVGANRSKIDAAIKKVQSETVELPVLCGGEKVYTGNVKYQVSPFDHSNKIAKYHVADEALVKETIKRAVAARKAWDRTPFEERAKILLKVADMISGKYRFETIANTMVGQGKTVFEADIDAIAELADFYRFAVHYAREMLQGPELHQPKGVSNKLQYRGLEGFVAAVSPFNFTAIGGNLAGTPALMGNVVLWKPASTAILSQYRVMEMFQEAGLPDGVINFVPSSGSTFGNAMTTSPHLAAVNFTGSVDTFKRIWRMVTDNLDTYRTYPKLVGECGGKNYHFVHMSADLDVVVNSTIRAAFGYQGQKCSACSRLYVPKSRWPEIKEALLAELKTAKMGSPVDIDNTFMTAVIDEASFDNIKTYLDFCKSSDEITVLAGGNCDKSVGYFVEPTIVETSNPYNKMMKEEIFGPVVCAYVYPDEKYKEMMDVVDNTNEFSLTGAIFGEDPTFIEEARDALRESCGNFYVNDKCTGSVVAQQPFGGARMSGTNDKAGGPMYLGRWVSPLSVKEAYEPQGSWRYPQLK